MVVEPTTLGRLFWNSVENHGDSDAQTWHDGEEWHTRSYMDFGAAVKNVAHGLISLGVKKGDRVAIWSKNCPAWAEVDFANASLGAASVPIYDTLTGSQGAYILKNSGAKVLFVQDGEVLDRVWEHLGDLKSLKQVVMLDGNPNQKDVMALETLYQLGSKHAQENEGMLEKRVANVKPDDLASLVYTSGTTGDPKGVQLSQWNFASNSLIAKDAVGIDTNDKFLSFLPLSHVFERTGGHFTAYSSGSHVVYARSILTLTEDMGIHKPTIMMSVPRLYEKIYGKIMAGINGASFLKKFIFNWAIAQGKAANVYRQRNEPLPASLQKKVDRADKLVFGKLKAAVGGKLRYFVSGGAALSQEIEEFFWAAGIQILQGYGLTETSPVTNVNLPYQLRFGSVGKAVRDTEIMIDTSEWNSARTDVVEGEICVKGPQVMSGYYKNKSATDEVFDKEGYFHTGDVGFVDDDGYLFITDRKKEIIVMSNGKNVAPQHIEGLLKLQPHIEQACAIGDDRKYMTALICPDFEALEAFATENGIAAEGEALVADQRVVSLIEQQVELVNAQLPRYEQIKKFWIVPRAWSVEDGELTPTLKLKRRIISDKFKTFIDGLYPGQ